MSRTYRQWLEVADVVDGVAILKWRWEYVDEVEPAVDEVES